MKATKRLHYELTGSGPTVVLLHGFLGSGRYWQRLVSKLSEHNRVIAIDLLGFGKSPKPVRSRYDYTAHTASIHATLESIGLNEPFVLIGHSMGSLVALRYSRLYPQQVRKLLLTNMPIHLTSAEARKDIYGTSFIYAIGLRPVLHDFVWPIFKAVTYLRLLPERTAGGAFHRRSYMFQNRGWSRLRSLRNVIFAAKIEADLRALEMKTVLLSGMHDRASYLKNIAILKFDDNIRSLVVPGGHHLPLTDPELIARYAN